MDSKVDLLTPTAELEVELVNIEGAFDSHWQECILLAAEIKRQKDVYDIELEAERRADEKANFVKHAVRFYEYLDKEAFQ